MLVKVRNQHDCKSLLGTIHLTIYDEYVKHDIIDLLIRKALVVIIYQYFLHTMFNILISKKMFNILRDSWLCRDQHALDFDCWEIDKYPVA